MRLFVNPRADNKVYLNVQARTRLELARKLGSLRFELDGNTYHVNDVKAESSSGDALSGAVVGGVIGLIGGPVGALIGASLGGLIGDSSANAANDDVERFNQSSI